jgi:hypothetical protein
MSVLRPIQRYLSYLQSGRTIPLKTSCTFPVFSCPIYSPKFSTNLCIPFVIILYVLNSLTFYRSCELPQRRAGPRVRSTQPTFNIHFTFIQFPVHLIFFLSQSMNSPWAFLGLFKTILCRRILGSNPRLLRLWNNN